MGAGYGGTFALAACAQRGCLGGKPLTLCGSPLIPPWGARPTQFSPTAADVASLPDAVATTDCTVPSAPMLAGVGADPASTAAGELGSVDVRGGTVWRR